MANKISTSFELKNLNTYISGIERAEQSLDHFTQKAASFANLKPPSLNVPAIDADLKAATTQIKLYENERLNIAKSNSALALNLKKAETKSLADEARAQTRTFKSELNSISSSIKSESAKSSTSLKDLAGTFGIAFGATALVGSGIKFLKDSTTAAFDAERANRKLSASATEAGLAYGVLADKNREFAKSAGLSETAATNITAKIAQLATFSGRPQDIDKLQKSFLDLSAAKGIGSGEIDNLIGTILSGQDEGLNRLGIGDPGQLYKAYAKEIGTTADSLSQFQKVQAATNAVVEKAAIFTGANADKMQSLSGQAEQANAQIENLYTNFGQGLSQSNEFRDFLGFANSALGSLTTNLQNVKKELDDGKTPRQIATENADSTGARFLDSIKDGSGAVLGAFIYPIDILTKGAKEATDIYRETAAGASKRRIETDTQLFTAEDKNRKQQLSDAAEQQKQLAGKTFATSFQSQVESLIKPSGSGLSKKEIQYKDIIKLEKSLNDELSGVARQRAAIIGGKFGDLQGFTTNAAQPLTNSQVQKAREGIERVKGEFYSQRVDNAAKQFGRNPSFADAQFDLKALDSIKNFIPTEKFEDFKDKLNDFIANNLKKAADLVKDFSKQTTDLAADLYQKRSADNPFVSLFSEADVSARKLRETTRGLSDDLIKDFQKINDQTNSLKLFQTKLDNSLAISDLRSDADNFRNSNRYKPGNYQNVIDRSLSGKSNPFGFGKTYGQFVQEGAGKNPITKEQQNDIYNVETFNALKRNGVDPSFGIQYLGKVRGAALGSEDLTLQQRLDKKIDLITSSNPQNEQQRAIAERALISLTSGVDPNKLTDRQRDRCSTGAGK